MVLAHGGLGEQVPAADGDVELFPAKLDGQIGPTPVTVQLDAGEDDRLLRRRGSMFGRFRPAPPARRRGPGIGLRPSDDNDGHIGAVGTTRSHDVSYGTSMYTGPLCDARTRFDAADDLAPARRLLVEQDRRRDGHLVVERASASRRFFTL